jgi:hypothetical protein
MISQLKAMEAYISILSIRIGLNSRVTEEVADTTAEPCESGSDE